MAGYGLSVTDQIPIQHMANPHNEAYLRAKRERLGHTLHHQGLPLDEEMLHEEREHDRAAARGEEDGDRAPGGSPDGEAAGESGAAGEVDDREARR
jgi:3,4-dihydroxy 2-butanone 4-phosphate synthase/GTP cyclohydrolase II